MIARRALVSASVGALLALTFPASAAPGDLDPAFSGDGRTTVSFPSGAQGTSVAMQGKKVIVGGTTAPNGSSDFGIARLKVDGTLDGTFGNGGRVRIDVFGKRDSLGEVAVLADGKIVVVGAAEKKVMQSRVVVMRLKPNGGLDRSFGGDGIVIADTPGTTGAAAAVVPLPDGRLAVGATIGGEETSFAVLRYRSDGRLDRSFGDDGIAVANFATRPSTSLVDLVRWGPSDWLLAVGEAGSTGGFDIGLASFRPDGTPDPNFGGTDGKAIEDIGYDYVGSVISRPLGFFVVTGFTDTGGGWDAMFARFNASGHLDQSWGGGDGVVLHDAGTTLEYWFGAAAAGKKIVVAGQIDGDAAVMRIRGGGGLDGTFGTGGYAVTPFSGGDSIARALTIGSGGRVVAAGTAPATLVNDGFAVERLLGS